MAKEYKLTAERKKALEEELEETLEEAVEEVPSSGAQAARERRRAGMISSFFIREF